MLVWAEFLPHHAEGLSLDSTSMYENDKPTTLAEFIAHLNVQKARYKFLVLENISTYGNVSKTSGRQKQGVRLQQWFYIHYHNMKASRRDFAYNLTFCF